MKILVTGGAGFIGSALVRLLVRETEHAVINIDKLTYAASPAAVEEAARSPRYRFVQADVADIPTIGRALETHQPDAILHLAAETHVDRSIDAAAGFVQTNVFGTYGLLEAALAYWRARGRPEAFRFLQVSTDEVFGSTDEGRFSENSPYHPNSPYAASKASGDHFARAWQRTFGLPVIGVFGCNNFGPFQFPEKLIPVTIIRALRNSQILVYGDGANVRDWIYVEDFARALTAVLEHGAVGETYCVGADNERRNIDVVRQICSILDRELPGQAPHARLIDFVTDRPGHDRRYALDSSKARRATGWQARESFDSGLDRTVRWYLEHRSWWEPILERHYGGERLGAAIGAAH